MRRGGSLLHKTACVATPRKSPRHRGWPAWFIEKYICQVTHLLPANTSNLDDYILLHPDAAKYIWFPDIYIGKQYLPNLKNICVWALWEDNLLLFVVITFNIPSIQKNILTTSLRYTVCVRSSCGKLSSKYDHVSPLRLVDWNWMGWWM